MIFNAFINKKLFTSFLLCLYNIIENQDLNVIQIEIEMTFAKHGLSPGTPLESAWRYEDFFPYGTAVSTPWLRDTIQLA